MGPSLFVGKGDEAMMDEISSIPEHKERMYNILKALVEAGDFDEYDLYDTLARFARNHDIMEDDGYRCDQCGEWNFCYQAECKADF
jgi:hypothetical protein